MRKLLVAVAAAALALSACSSEGGAGADGNVIETVRGFGYRFKGNERGARAR